MNWKGWKISTDGEEYVQVSPAEDVALISSGIAQILNTVPGERRMLPEFGSRLKYLVFEPHDVTLYAELGHEVIEAVQRWEKRVSIVDVQVRPVEGNEHGVYLRVVWQLRSNQEISSSVDVKVSG